MMRLLLRGWVGMLALLFVGGCVTAAQGDRMRSDIDALKNRFDQREQEIKQSRAELAQLHNVLKQATDLLTRNSADVGAQVQKLQTALADATGKIEEIQHRLGEL